jgi:hypothetical protein
MSFSAHRSRTDEKLGLILSQVGLLRRRLNSLAIQRAFFVTAAGAAAAFAVIFVAAFLLSPLAFLISAAVAAAIVLFAVGRGLRSAWRMRSSASYAAALADERAALKGRLTTIVQTAPEHHRGALWAFLIEDALGRREEFVPAKIERRRIDRSMWSFLGAMVVALLAIPFAMLHQPRHLAVPGKQADITMNLDDLQVRAAGPEDTDGIQVEADAATMRRLEDKLAQQGGAGSAAGASGSMNHLLDRARSLAGRMQSKLRGEAARKQRLTLKLAENDPGLDPMRRGGTNSQSDAARKNSDPAGQFKREHDPNSSENSLPPMGKVAHDPRNQQMMQGGMGNNDVMGAGKTGARADSTAASDSNTDSSGGQASNGGPSHGIGADPEGLFGEPADSKMSTEGFEISIEARSMEHGAKGAGQAYLPPKVRTPLNSHQQPDEPVARAAIPANDRTTIQRVFER